MQAKQRSVIKRIVSIKEDVKRLHLNYQSSSRLFVRSLDAFNVPRYELENYEADDIMGTLAKEASEQGASVKVISGDKDLLQLVSDNTLVCIPRKGLQKWMNIRKEALFENTAYHQKQIIDMKGLMGDQSDNIPGVPGVGEKRRLNC